MQIAKPFVITAFIFGLLGCGFSSSDDEVERTYPEAFSFETVTIQQLLTEVETPDSVNIEAYVFAINQCPDPKIATCFAPDGIWTSESLPPTDTLFITTVKPKQFQKNKQYKISLSVDKRENKNYPDLRILGYSNIK